eukprot:7299856-Prymnesium_polylepis.1
MPRRALLIWRTYGAHVLTPRRPTNQAGMGSAPSTCSSVLDAATISAVRGTAVQEPACVWLSASVLQINLNVHTTVAVGSALTVLPGVVHPLSVQVDSSCLDASGTSVCASGSIVVQAPTSPVIPVAELSAPGLLGICDDLSLNGRASTGGGIFSLEYNWTVAVVNGTVSSTELASLRAALQSTTASLTVVRTLLPTATTLEFGLRVTNRAGGVSDITSVFVTKSSAPVLLVSFDGGITSKSTTRPKRVSLIAVVGIPKLDCVEGITTAGMLVDFSWTVCAVGAATCSIGSLPAGAVTLKGGRELVFPAGTLVAGTTYVVQVAVAPIGDAAAVILGGFSSLALK